MTLLAERSPAVTIEGPVASIAFDRFDLAAYQLFIRAKKLPESQTAYDWETDRYTVTTPARFAALLGIADPVERPERLPIPEHLFDYQRDILTMCLDAQRFAAWWDTGLGKTLLILEWCRQVAHLTNGRVLILENLGVIPQLIEECQRFYGETFRIARLETREDLAAWCKEPGQAVGIVNPEKFIPGILSELRYLAGLAFDESSRLKSGGGTIKWNIIKSARGIPFKLSATATPAPNEVMEYASQASFLEKLRTEGDILWTYFVRDKYGNWKVKPHARQAFYQFMASWSIYLRDPAHFGWGDVLAGLPPPEIVEYDVPITDVQREWMYGFLTKANKGLFTDDRMGVQERSKLSQLAKGFLYEKGETARRAVRIESHKPAKVAEIIRAEVKAGRQVLVWTVFDEESAIIREQLAGAVVCEVLDGSMSEGERLEILNRFRGGDVEVLISKAQMIGFGMNFQHCRSMVFSGWDDSFERMYQSIRRCYRFGQTDVVRIHIPYVRELEGMMLDNVKAKEAQFLADVAECEANYISAMGGRVDSAHS